MQPDELAAEVVKAAHSYDELMRPVGQHWGAVSDAQIRRLLTGAWHHLVGVAAAAPVKPEAPEPPAVPAPAPPADAE